MARPLWSDKTKTPRSGSTVRGYGRANPWTVRSDCERTLGYIISACGSSGGPCADTATGNSGGGYTLRTAMGSPQAEQQKPGRSRGILRKGPVDSRQRIAKLATKDPGQGNSLNR